ncbi:hypothetical protein L1987_42880 [Smallanthus sonchifolius]|uniref:Uncharacterized protein n=1 Tax=Smallanthus sonchifolius TaxID=185202 RepID=A0ACB9GKU9_9ASTR|nr:hypothetical protein L1987_42880 [Smallanthus sonchifolius]
MTVKVTMQGAAYGRKVDLQKFNSYEQLYTTLNEMFKEFADGNLAIGELVSDYNFVYKDGDGDWMVMGDLPWNMFITTCKSLMIIKVNAKTDLELRL